MRWLKLFMLTALLVGCSGGAASQSTSAPPSESSILLRESFDSPDATTFYVGEAPDGAVMSVNDGAYDFTAQTNRWEYQVPDHSFPATYKARVADAVAQTTVSLPQTGTAGLVARASTTVINGEGRRYSFYACWIASWGSAGCTKYVESHGTTLFATPAGSITTADHYDLRLAAINYTLRFEVNGVEVGVVDDDDLNTGTWGLCVFSTEHAPTTASFDSFQLMGTVAGSSAP